MPYHFKRDESLPDAIRRVVAEELEAAIGNLSRRPDGNHDEAVREARKSVKKVRAALRLIRPELGKIFSEDDARLRHVGANSSELCKAVALTGATE